MVFVIFPNLKTSAQTIENIRTIADNERVIIEYDLYGSFANLVNVEVKIKINDSKVIIPSQISGDLNAVLPGRSKRIVWEALKEMGVIDAEMRVELSIQSKQHNIQSKQHKEVKIGTQVWMTENLNVEKFRNGDLIPEAKTLEKWKDAGKRKQPAWCYYENNPANGEKYGKLYNWYAVNDPRGLAPEGWHIPFIHEWKTLTEYLGGGRTAGGKLKSTSGWDSRFPGNNRSGFLGLPGGSRTAFAGFNYFGEDGYWWSATEFTTLQAWYQSLNYIGFVDRSQNLRDNGYSVRCLKD
jgi:uncharacterized protein (TIGR02145 family)